MELIITEKNIAAEKIADLLAVGKAKKDKVFNTPVYRFTRVVEGQPRECVTIGLRGHILEVDFPPELIYAKKGRSKQHYWVGLTEEGEAIEAPCVPASLPTPPWPKKRSPFTEEGVKLSGWKLEALPYLTGAPLLKLPAERDLIRSLKNLAKKADSLIIAPDFDREGELIGADALATCRAVNPAAPARRARYSAIIKKEIDAAFSEEGLCEMDFNLAAAGESRQHIDLIWGAVLTRYLTTVKYGGLRNVRSAGRVQTPTLALVVDREQERQAFVPEDYWVITAQLAAGQQEFTATHATARFKVEEEAAAVMDRLAAASTATVTAVEKKQRRVAPPAPFNTTSLMAAASAEGIKPARCMRIAESLYMNGLISYPRVDNTVYPAGLDYAATLKTLAKNPAYAPYANQLLARGVFTPTRGKQETTDPPPLPPTGCGTPDTLSAEEWKLYNLVARRFMATLSDAAVVEGTKVSLDIAAEPFTAKGDVLVQPGFRAIYPYGLKKDEQLPALAAGDTANVCSTNCAHKQTEPPARFSSGKLIQEMEKAGLGTKATRHDMIERLYSRRYIVNDPIEPTALGIAVINALSAHAPLITTPNMTAQLEDEMTQIAEGQRTRDEVVAHSRVLLGGVLEDLIPRAQEVADTITDAVVADSRVGTCPKCGGDLCVKNSLKTRSSFVGCNNWPDCDVTYPLPQGKYDEAEGECPVCGGAQIKVTPFRNKPYVHCLNPECASNIMVALDLGECPDCVAAGREGGRLIAQKNPRTLKRFVRCSNHPDCEKSYPLPQRGNLEATGEVCSTCGAPEVVLTTARGPWRICVNMNCPGKEAAEKKPAKKTTKKTATKRKTTTKKK